MSSEGRPLGQVRSSCRAVARRAVHVRIAHDRLADYAASLARHSLELPELDPECHYLGHGDDTAAFVFTLDAVNFGSATLSHLRPFAGHQGYFAIAAALHRRYRERGPLTAAVLAQLGAEECAELFGQELRAPYAGDLIRQFADALNQLGRFLLERFGGRFEALLDAAEGSAERLVELLTAMPFYRDLAAYRGREVAFLKRAQLTAADLSLALGNRARGPFDDLDRLTIFADDMVPHVLRLDGVLEYGRELAARIDAAVPLAAGGAEEVEIRACAVAAAELLVTELDRRGRRVSAMQLDYFLWNRGQGKRYQTRPRHLTFGIYY